MKAVYHKIDLSIEKLVEEELPYMKTFYNHKRQLSEDVLSLFSFASENSDNMPFYTISERGCQDACSTLTQAYSMMVEAVGRAFRDRSALLKFFDCDFLRRHGDYFIPYAAYSFRTPGLIGQTMYGRFDAAFDPKSEKITGIYEFNGDTPVMLFESVNLQNRLTRQVTGSNYAQCNDYYESIGDMLRSYNFGTSKEFAVVFDCNYVEDSATCETLTQIIGEHAICYYRDLDDLVYDYERPEKPFVFKNSDDHLDGIFVLSPWEEMVHKFPHAFKQWTKWVDNVCFFEPPWRWFMSHKGIWAYITHLMDTDTDFNSRWNHLPILRTHLYSAPFVTNRQPYVSKPVIGRLSSNIQIFDGQNDLLNASEGDYGACERVYQEYCPPHQVEGRNNFIAGCWMASESRVESRTHNAEAVSFCIREFDSPVLDVRNERFIPHIVV